MDVQKSLAQKEAKNLIVLIEDDEGVRFAISETLKKQGFRVKGFFRADEALGYLERADVQAVVTDLKMEPMDGFEFIEKYREINSNVPILLITAHGSIDAAIKAIKIGANEFIEKPFPPEILLSRIGNLLQQKSLGDENQKLKGVQALKIKDEVEANLIKGSSATMREVLNMADRVAQTDSTVLILGESGTGKELLAQYIHHKSRRSDGPYIKTNCCAFAEGVLESELFGHEKGSFTGAHQSKAGRFELADMGTIFLDEIGEISLTTQVKLLRVIQEREIERVGGVEAISLDSRIVAATNRNLEEMVKDGSFRQDLFYRLNIFPIKIPPLRERKQDIVELSQHFIESCSKRTFKKIEKIEDSFLSILKAYSWPGNVRELENIIERAMIFAQDGILRAEDVQILNKPENISQNLEAQLNSDGSPLSLTEMLERFEKKLIQNAIRNCDGNKSKAARSLGLKPNVLHYKLEKYEILNPS